MHISEINLGMAQHLKIQYFNQLGRQRLEQQNPTGLLETDSAFIDDIVQAL